MTNKSPVKNISRNEFPVFDDVETPKGAVNNILRSVNYKKGGVTGLVSSLNTQYLVKLKKEAQSNSRASLEAKNSFSDEKRPSVRIKQRSVPLFLRNSWEKHDYMHKVIPGRNSDSPENFTTVEMARQGYSPPKKVKVKNPVIINDTTTVVAINSNDWIVQPKFMENKGSMCMCEFWNERDKQKIAQKYQAKIVNITRKSAGKLSNSYLGVLRPEQLEVTKNILKMLKEHKHGMDVKYTDFIRAKEQNARKPFKLQKSNSVANIPTTQVQLEKKNPLFLKSNTTVDLPKVEEEAAAKVDEKEVEKEEEKVQEIPSRVQMNRISLMPNNMEALIAALNYVPPDQNEVIKVENENNQPKIESGEETNKTQKKQVVIKEIKENIKNPQRSESIKNFVYKKNLEAFKRSKSNGSFRIKLLSQKSQADESKTMTERKNASSEPNAENENSTFLNQSMTQIGEIQSSCKQTLDDRKVLDSTIIKARCLIKRKLSYIEKKSVLKNDNF